MAKFKKGHKGYWLGKKNPHSKATNEKISKTLMGHLVSVETRKKIGLIHIGNKYSVGIKRSEEMKEKIRQTLIHKGIEPKIKFVGFGKNHPRWKGGPNLESHRIRGRIEYRLWRESVFARDNWTCQKTGVKGGELNAHHIKNFSKFVELRTSIENGITLSKKTHKEFHKIYGKKDNTEEQLEEFLKL